MSNMTYLILFFYIHLPHLNKIPSPFWFQQAVSGILGAIGVACGAFGAHGLKNYTSDPSLLESWKTAASYQMLHVPWLGDDGFLRKEWLINQE